MFLFIENQDNTNENWCLCVAGCGALLDAIVCSSDPTTRGTKVIIFQIVHIGACTTDKIITLIRGSILDTMIFPPT